MARKISNSSKSTVDKAKPEKKRSIYLGDYYCMKELQPRPVTEALLKMIAEKLIEWAQYEDSMSMTSFLQALSMDRSDYNRWRERSEELRRADAYARALIGNRRELGAITRKYDGSMIKYSLWQYAPEYKESAEFHARLSKSTSDTVGGNAQFVVHMSKVESDDEDMYFEAKE